MRREALRAVQLAGGGVLHDVSNLVQAGRSPSRWPFTSVRWEQGRRQAKLGRSHLDRAAIADKLQLGTERFAPHTVPVVECIQCAPAGEVGFNVALLDAAPQLHQVTALGLRRASKLCNDGPQHQAAAASAGVALL